MEEEHKEYNHKAEDLFEAIGIEPDKLKEKINVISDFADGKPHSVFVEALEKGLSKRELAALCHNLYLSHRRYLENEEL